MPTVPTSMSKLSNTKYVRNNTGASGAQQEDTDQDTSTDQMREQCRLYKKDRLNFETQTESSEYAAVLKQWESAMAGVVETTSNGAGEFARLQVTSAKVQPLKFYADHCLLFQRSTKSLARQGWHHDHMQIAQLDTRDLTVIMEGHQQYGARCWELCSLSSKQATSITPPDGCISILAFSTYGNAGIKHGVTPVPRFPEWPATLAGEIPCD